VTISGIEVFTRYVNWRSWLFVKLTTDDGLEGWGEGSTSDRAKAVSGVIEHFTPRLLGRDPDEIELIWRDLYTGWRGGPIVNSAIAAIDGALWDLKGKRYGLPVWKLLGGPIRRQVRVYAGGISRWIDSVEDHRRGTAEVVAAGYKGAKVTPFGLSGKLSERRSIDFAVEVIGAMRAEAGPEFEIFVECAERLTPRLAIEASQALAEFHPIWMEEPIPADNVKAMCELAPRMALPIACGEKLFSRHDYRELLEGNGAAFIQPDLTHAGGITEVRKIAAAAETTYVQVAPHNSGGPVSAAMALQIAAIAPNFFVLETALPEDALRVAVGGDAVRIHDGYMQLSDAPGLGLEMNLDALEDVPAGDEPVYRWRHFKE
jgi:galactonate dehydratase